MRAVRVPALLALAVVASATRPVWAQDSTDATFRCDTAPTVDRVIAVVGDAPILASQVDEEVFSQRAEGVPLPPSDQRIEFCRAAISRIIDAELLVQQALRDTAIKVTDEDIADAVEARVRQIRQRFTSEIDYRNELRAAGFQTPDEYRRWLIDQQRKQLLQSRLIEHLDAMGQLPNVAPTEKEMREYFEQQRSQLGRRPATVSFENIVIAPKPTEEAREAARALADSIARELRKGADFATAARRFSDDPASREQGGELNWFRRGIMVPEFEKVAFSLRPGVISDPVETPFGFHIIQVLRVQPAEVQARHILIRPEVTKANADSAAALAARVHAAAVAGASFDSLQRLYHDRSEEAEAEGVPIDKLPEDYRAGIDDVPAGQIAPLFTIRKEEGLRQKYVVLKVTERTPEGEVQFEDVRDAVRRRLGRELAIRRYLDRLRRAMYVEIRL